MILRPSRSFVRNDRVVQLNNWSISENDASEIQDWSGSRLVRSIYADYYYPSYAQARRLDSSNKLVKCCSSISPFCRRLLLGIIPSALSLITMPILFLLLHYKTALFIPDEVPTGTILLFSGNPLTLTDSSSVWLFCDGSEVSRSTYGDLFNVIGVTYGSGNGIDTFNVPDFRARFPLGSNSSGDRNLAAGGASSHVMAVAELPTHSHDQGSLTTAIDGLHMHGVSDPGHNHGGSTGPGPFSYGDDSLTPNGGGGGEGEEGHAHSINSDVTSITLQSDGSHTHVLQGSTGTQGLNKPINIMPSYQTIHYIIRT